MAAESTNQTNEFIVKESSLTNIIIGLVFLGLFLLTLANYLNNDHVHGEYAARKLRYVLIGTSMPAILFIVKGFIHTTIIKVNKDGIYCAGELKTNWENFINAEVKEIPVTGSYSDNFILFIRFYKSGEDDAIETRVPMLSTYNKSGEEVIEAIKNFHLKEDESFPAKLPS